VAEILRMVSLGPFLLQRMLGKGAYSVVRLGTHEETGFCVAIKFMPKVLLNGRPSLWVKMRREIAVLRLIDHPRIMKLYDVFETSRCVCLILEFVPGGEVYEMLVKGGALNHDTTLRMFYQALTAVHHLHAQSIYHRDLKLENMLLDIDENIKVSDMGMAKIAVNGRLMETSCGSPHYASPQVVTGVAYSGSATDGWSLGIVLFALRTATLPFDHKNQAKLLNIVANAEYKIPEYVEPDIADLIRSILRKEQSERPTTSAMLQLPIFEPYRQQEQQEQQRSTDLERKTYQSIGDEFLTPVTDEEQAVIDRGIQEDVDVLDWKEESSTLFRRLKERRHSRLEVLSVLSPMGRLRRVGARLNASSARNSTPTSPWATPERIPSWR
jgi:serine/threonine protein kinase